jgi:hypothetical protein
MKTQSNIKKESYNFQRSTYDPALDRFQGQIIFKEKHRAAEEFLKKHGLPKEFYEKSDSNKNASTE